jgi:outer membrane protein OmpA-like peptidoglycan-associated protein
VRSAGGTRDRLLVGACLGALGVLAWLCVLRHGPALAATRAAPAVVAPPPVVVPPPVQAAPEPPPAPPPVPTPLRVQAEFDRLLAAGRIEFETGSNRLRPDGLPLLDAIAGELVAAPELAVEVEGHTDNRGDPGTNRLLSQRRALAVKDYLVAKGIAPGRIHTIGSGATRPIVRANTPEAHQINRRIEVRVLTPGSR